MKQGADADEIVALRARVRELEAELAARKGRQGRSALDLDLCLDLMDRSETLFFLRGPDGRFLHVSRSFERMFGLPPGGAVGRSSSDFLPPEAARVVDEENRRVLESGEIASGEHCFEVDGRPLSYRYVKIPLRDAGGRPLGLAGILENTTQLRAAQVSELEHARLFEAMFRRHGAVMYLVEPQTLGLADGNDAALRFYGYSREEFVRLRIPDLNTLPEDEIRAEIAAARAEGRDHFRFRHRLASGDIRDVEIRSTPIRIRDRELFFAVVTDVSGRVRAERALAQKSGDLETLFDAVEDFLFILRPDGGVIRCNRSVRERLGYADEDLARMNVLDFHPPQMRQEAVAVFKDILAGRVEVCPLPLLARDGTQIPVETRVSLGRWGNLPAFFGISRDLTERTCWERALLDQKELFATMLESAPFGVVLGDALGRILLLNEEFTRLTGYAVADIPDSEAWFGLAYPDPAIRAEVEARWARIAGGGRDMAEYPIRCKDGRTRTFEFRASLLDNGRYMVTLVDVSDRRDMQAELMAAKEAAEAASRAKDVFLANMSHEIRTPISGIAGMAEVLLDQGGLGDKARRLGLILESARTLEGIVSDILDLSRIAAGRLSPSREPFDLKALVLRELEPFRIQSGAKGVAVDFRSDPDLPALVEGDPVRLGQVLRNLLSNAVKFTRAGFVRLNLRRDATRPEEDRLLFSVRDTGPGIPAEARERIFEEFVQLDPSEAREHGGAGLGLGIARRLAGLMGGTLTVESAAGQGSVFLLSLPLPEVRQAAPPAPQAPEIRPSGRLRLLLVEDNPLNQEFMLLLLEGMGHRVTVAANGGDALEILGRVPFDAVLMDVQMPVMDGLEATRRIRGGEVPGCRPDLPVLALTAYALKGDRERMLAAGMDEYVTKPVNRRLLTDALARVVGTAGPAPAEPPPPAAGLSEKARSGLLARFLELVPARLEALDRAVALGDLAETARLAHQFAGTASAVSEQELGRAARDLSAAAGRGGGVGREYEEFRRLAAEALLRARRGSAAS